MSIFPSTWMQYSQKLIDKILKPQCNGSFAKEREGMRLALGEEGSLEEGLFLRIYVLVDEFDGIIADSKFQVFGPSALIGIAEGLCELLLRKNTLQARNISASFLEQQLRDTKGTPSLPDELYPLLDLSLSAMRIAMEKCMDIPIDDPTAFYPEEIIEGEGYPDFETLSKEEKLQVIEQILTDEIRPFIALDAGGVEILDFEENILKISFQGNCVSCPSSTGSTLDAIQRILHAKASKDITVIPDFSYISE